MDITIRRAGKADIPAIKAVYEQPSAYQETLQLPYPSERAWSARFESENEYSHNLVAVCDNRVVGQLMLMTSPKARQKHVASFAMAVCDSLHNHGIGSRLLESALDMCDNWLNIKRVELQVYVDNPAAIALYQKYGFVKEGEHKSAAFKRGKYVDLYTMARVIPHS